MQKNKPTQIKKRILMVCLGNICRSPLAEGILKSKLDNSFFIDSAGTGNWHVGEKPDSRSVEVARNHHIDISSQRARHFTIEDFEAFDTIFVMDQENYKNVVSLATHPTWKEKVKEIVTYSPTKIKKIPDPYYGTISDFESVFELLDTICGAIALEMTHNG